MLVNPNSLLQGPLLRPQWRLERVVQLISHRPIPLQPGRYDDHYVRAYYRIMLDLAAAGDDAEKLDQVFRQYPAVCHAHRLHYSADLERRQILEARLLTSETFAEIAVRLATEPSVIEYYERLFFNIRDRLQSSGWIILAGIGRRSGSPDDQRGYVYRLFAYFGGPLVLDAVISGMESTEIPRQAEDVPSWFTRRAGSAGADNRRRGGRYARAESKEHDPIH